jgi:hypothetical protein
MEKLNLIVRRDWQDLQFNRARENTRLWRLGQVLILLSALAVFWVTLLRLPPLWQNLLRTALTWAPFLTFFIWVQYRGEKPGLRYFILVYLAFAGLCGLSAFFDPRVPGGISRILPFWTVIASLVIPVLSWMLMIPAIRNFPHKAKRIGLHTNEWLPNALIGVLSGSALALHLLYTTSLLPPTAVARLEFSRSALFWSFSLLAGLWVPGEEIMSRGLAFRLLHQEAHNSFGNTTLRITLLNVLFYLVLALQTPSITLGVVTIVYRTALSLINVFLFYRRKSLVPCMASNLVFTFIMMQLFKL